MKKKLIIMPVVALCILVPSFIRVTESPGWQAMRNVDVLVLVAIGFAAGAITVGLIRGARDSRPA